MFRAASIVSRWCVFPSRGKIYLVMSRIDLAELPATPSADYTLSAQTSIWFSYPRIDAPSKRYPYLSLFSSSPQARNVTI